MESHDAERTPWVYANIHGTPYFPAVCGVADVPRWLENLYAAIARNRHAAAVIILWTIEFITSAATCAGSTAHALAILTAILDTVDLDRVGFFGIVALRAGTTATAAHLSSRPAFLARAEAWLLAAGWEDLVRWWRAT